jgi:hypothetical protein
MTFKVNSLSPFDKKFFGKSMKSWGNRNIGEPLKSSKLKLDSVDEFNKYFQQKTFDLKAGKSAIVKDTFDMETLATKPSIF